MKTVPGKSIYLALIAFVAAVMLVSCASSPEPKPEDTAGPAPTAPEPGAGKEPTALPQPGATGPGVTTAPVAKPKPSPETAYFVHTVKWRGESVSIIAGWYTGDIQNWKILRDHNPDINPNRIFEGNKIRIPEYLMKNKAPMTKEYVDSFYSKSPSKKEAGKPAPSSPPSADNGDEPTLFGPK